MRKYPEISINQLAIPFLKYKNTCELCDVDSSVIASHYSDGKFAKCSYCNRLEQLHTHYGR